jgi:hypothetical protein
MAEKRKRTSSNQGGGIISSVVGQTARVAEETTRIAGELIDSATSAANTARETGAEWVKGVSPTAAEVIRPGARKRKAAGGRAARQPRLPGHPDGSGSVAAWAEPRHPPAAGSCLRLPAAEASSGSSSGLSA